MRALLPFVFSPVANLTNFTKTAPALGSAMSAAKRQCTAAGEPGERQPVVLVDMDGTIADFDGRVYALIAASHPDVTPPLEPLESLPDP